MKAQIDQITTMSETLESAGFSPQQSNAVINSVAMAVEKFAVTPEMLDDRINKVLAEMRSQFAAQAGEIKEVQRSVTRLERKGGADIKEVERSLGADIKEVQRSVTGLERSMIAHQKSMLRYMMLFTLLLLSAVVGAILTQIF